MISMIENGAKSDGSPFHLPAFWHYGAAVRRKRMDTRMEAPAPKPGQMTLWTMQSIAHGADYVSFFRWRTATVGTEIYWHGILDYDNRYNRKLQK